MSDAEKEPTEDSQENPSPARFKGWTKERADRISKHLRENLRRNLVLEAEEDEKAAAKLANPYSIDDSNPMYDDDEPL